jgi:hypothetical protein
MVWIGDIHVGHRKKEDIPYPPEVVSFVQIR